MISGCKINSSVFKVGENQRWEKQKENAPSGLKKLEEMTEKKDFFSFTRLLLLKNASEGFLQQKQKPMASKESMYSMLRW